MSWDSWLLQHEVPLRLSAFFGIFMLMAGWELLRPRRVLRLGKLLRWGNNIALVFLNSALLRLLFPTAAIGMALWVQEQQWGLLNQLDLPLWLGVPLTLLLLDLLIYWQHRLFHRIPLLWRLHRVHHADPDYDVTTGARFHPLEILLSMLIKFAAILLLGPPLVAVLLFEVILNAMAMFNHGNVGLPETLDKWLRRGLVTPDMHRVHHSVRSDEMHFNFGFNLSIWDRLFSSYVAQPNQGHQQMQIGLPELDQPKDVSWLPGILLLPLKPLSSVSRYKASEPSDPAR
ncbi:sterol desaturase family protein [Marinobacterium jannaschii]|uniref:sterol desaturase family protein n=1 Tax=Marinobacterium jannaschii TaxID=64970 RepID=UPI0004875C02|nr:sterol desaturase family protein [Marinobacterium jannaschii]